MKSTLGFVCPARRGITPVKRAEGGVGTGASQHSEAQLAGLQAHSRIRRYSPFLCVSVHNTSGLADNGSITGKAGEHLKSKHSHRSVTKETGDCCTFILMCALLGAQWPTVLHSRCHIKVLLWCIVVLCYSADPCLLFPRPFPITANTTWLFWSDRKVLCPGFVVFERDKVNAPHPSCFVCVESWCRSVHVRDCLMFWSHRWYKSK